MLIADRFLVIDGQSLDLASGEAVRLERLRPGSVGDQAAWSDRCAALAEGGVLIDYGVLDDGRPFEVRRRGRKQRARVGAVRQAALHQVIDLLDAASFGEPRLVRLPPMDAADRAGTLAAMARHARQRGFVPVSADLLLGRGGLSARAERAVEAVARTRHVLLIADPAPAPRPAGALGEGAVTSRRCVSALARLIVSLGVTTARPNILVVGASAGSSVADGGCRGLGVGDDCVLAGCDLGRRRPRMVAAFPPYELAAETHEVHDAQGGPYLRRVTARAFDAVAVARAPARTEQALRDAAFALARRQDAEGAAWMAMNLGALLLERGRPQDAAKSFEMARQHFDRRNDARGAMRAATYIGLAWTDEGRLPEAEAAFRCARMAASESGAVEAEQDASLGLARCWYWQGRFDEATVLTSSLLDALEREVFDEPRSIVRDAAPPEGWSVVTGGLARPARALTIDEPRRDVRAAALSSRLALATGDVHGASSRAVLAVELARRTARPLDVCAARTAAAAVACALRDGDALLAHVREGLAAARRARAPLRSLRLRLLAADGLRRAGRERQAARFDRCLSRIEASRLPALLRERVRMVLSPALVPSRAVGGVPGAALVLAVPACPWRLPPARATLVDDVVGVLQACQDLEDEAEAVGRVCESVSHRVHALLVVVLGASRPTPACLARRGVGAARAGFGERVLDTGLPIGPSPAPGGLEAATPIRYAGSVIGAVVCRWAADTLVDDQRASGVLSAAAAAIAPHVRSLLDRLLAPMACRPEGEFEIIGVSEATIALRRAAERAASAPFPVLIEGESGVGKELVARAIHRGSARRGRRFSAVNCAALADDLLDAELFGHARGAFTGAIAERAGLFEESDGGTLFLDEVADLSARGQAKLLRAVQEGEVRRIGENAARRVDVRLVAATNRRLDDEVARGAFRRDLFYRLNVLHLDVRPLRERAEDIAVLAAHFWQRALERTGGRATLAPATLAALARYDWPGNVRELQNVLSALAVSALRRGSVGPACLPAVIACAETRGETLDQARRVFERRFVRAALARAGGHRGRAAAALGLSRQGLAKLLARLELAEESRESGASDRGRE
jgi:two-component system response regulator HydG